MSWPGCFECAHLDTEAGAICGAFPGGIPIEIASGELDHLVPREGDRGIQFEPKEGSPP